MKYKILLLICLALFSTTTAGAVSFTVNSTLDTADANIGDGACDDGGGNCTLRAAIAEANFTNTADEIRFSILPFDGSVKTITPVSALPDITQTVTIDGYTQPGTAPNTLTAGNNAVLLIEINGGSQNTDLLHLFADNNLIRGLVINRAPFDGIFLGNPNGFPTSGNIIEGNFIGTDPTGTIDQGNGRFGVSLFFQPSMNNIIGGTAPAARNVISGNSDGVVIGSGSINNTVRGNHIGTTASGTAALGNDRWGILVGSSANGNRILSNAMFSNGQLGIDLDGNGVTPNDTGDADTGSNNLQNFPFITSAVSSGGNTTIQGTLNSTANTNGFIIEFFASPSCDAEGNGEGQRILGSTTVNTDGNGNASINTTLASATAAGESLTATATDSAGNTSEFSQCLTIRGTPQTFTVTTTADAGAGSLRQAITEANSSSLAADTIAFNIAGAGVHSIAPTTALPVITDSVIIDGYTQPGSSVNTAVLTDNAVILIELDGAGAGANVDGLRFAASASGSTVRGLAINRFTRTGISLDGSDNNIIAGNFIGTDPTGSINLGNASVGVNGEFGSNANNNLIGGTTLAARNIISGNGSAGIEFGFAAGNVIQGNFIGLGSDGATAIGNSGRGVSIDSFVSGFVLGGDDAADGITDGLVNARNYISGNVQSGIFLGGAGFGGATVRGNYIGTDTTGTLARGNSAGISTNLAFGSIIGGTTAGAGNLISGNALTGITLGNTGSAVIIGNRIGTQANGISSLGNGSHGVEIFAGGNGNSIGGTGANEGNIIAFNSGDGVYIDSFLNPASNSILSNSIHSNGGLGIDLGVDGVTPNDSGDADVGGGNNLQNFPVITYAQTGSTRVVGTFNSTANQMFRLEFFSTPTANASGNGEGQIFIGSINVTTDGSGNAAFDQTFAPTTAIGSFVSATATNLATNDTSEFSNAKQIAGPTAATVSLGGRVLNETGRGVFGARVVMTDASGNVRYAMTNPFGFYRFAEVSAGETYVLTAAHKRYEFAAQVVFVSEDLANFNFVPFSKLPPEDNF